MTENRRSWTLSYHSAAYYAWRGNAFERICLQHIPQIKMALGISAVETGETAWLSVFIQEINPKKAVHVTLICGNGLKEGKYTSIAQIILTGDALFSC